MPNPTGILYDLLNVEVNTILKDNMTARKMPSLPFALLDIVEVYAEKLDAVGVDVNGYFGRTRQELVAALNTIPHDEATRLRSDADRTYRLVHGKPAAGDAWEIRFDYLPDLWPLFPVARRKSDGEDVRQSVAWRTMDQATNGWDSFERLRIAALHVLDDKDRLASLSATDRLVLQRIRRNCDQLKYIVQDLQQRPTRESRRTDVGGFGTIWSCLNRPIGGLPSWECVIPKTRDDLLHDAGRGKSLPLETLALEQITTIRKIWEVGTENVVAQTSVQIDGDLVTRISDEFVRDHATSAEQAQMLERMLRVHRDAVGTGLAHWHSLVDVALQIVRALGEQVRQWSKPTG